MCVGEVEICTSDRVIDTQTAPSCISIVCGPSKGTSPRVGVSDLKDLSGKLQQGTI